MPDEALTAAERIIGPIRFVELVSRTNSTVYRVVTARGQFIVKEISDPTVDAIQERALIQHFSPNSLFRPILHAQPLVNTGHTLVIAPYVEGISLDAVLSTKQHTSDSAIIWAQDLHSIFRLIGSIPVKGFGRPRQSCSPEYRRWTDFLDWYLARQKDKAPQLAVLRYQRLRDSFQKLRPHLDAVVVSPTLIPADINARNFLIRYPDRHLQNINMPIIWHGDPALPYAEAMIHFHDTSLVNELLKLGRFPTSRLNFYAAFSAYVILAYAERFNPAPLKDVLPWGGHRPLLELLDEYLERLSAGD